MTDYQHGTLNAYARGGCRCEACKAAWNTYYREKRQGAARALQAQEEANLILACALRDTTDELERVAQARLRWAEEAMEWRERALAAEELLAALTVAWVERGGGE